MINNSNESILMDDANSPEVNKTLLGKVSSDFVKVSEQIKEASYQIRKRGFSKNPIFVVSRRVVEIGVMLINFGEFENHYSYSASFFEEFQQRTLISDESVEMFLENFKNPDEFACLFVVEADFMGFVYVPFPED